MSATLFHNKRKLITNTSHNMGDENLLNFLFLSKTDRRYGKNKNSYYL